MALKHTQNYFKGVDAKGKKKKSVMFLKKQEQI